MAEVALFEDAEVLAPTEVTLPFVVVALAADGVERLVEEGAEVARPEQNAFAWVSKGSPGQKEVKHLDQSRSMSCTV